jgi:hypothetical protein
MKQVTQDNQEISWRFSPDNPPPEPGEYRATLDPSDVSPQARRWWNGKAWSNPYLESWSAEHKERIRKQPSAFRVFWAPV